MQTIFVFQYSILQNLSYRPARTLQPRDSTKREYASCFIKFNLGLKSSNISNYSRLYLPEFVLSFDMTCIGWRFENNITKRKPHSKRIFNCEGFIFQLQAFVVLKTKLNLKSLLTLVSTRGLKFSNISNYSQLYLSEFLLSFDMTCISWRSENNITKRKPYSKRILNYQGFIFQL